MEDEEDVIADPSSAEMNWEEKAKALETEKAAALASNTLLKEQLRNKEEKKPEAKVESSDPVTVVIDEDALVDKAVEKLQEKQADAYREKAFDWMSAQEWGNTYSSESDTNGVMTGKLSEALKTINKLHPVSTTEDYQRNLRLAHIAVTGETDEGLTEAMGQVAQANSLKRAAGGPSGGSSVRHDGKPTISQGAQDLMDKMGIKPKE